MMREIIHLLVFLIRHSSLISRKEIDMEKINIEEAFRVPVSRARLPSVLGVTSDRKARKMVEQLREQGYNIVNDGDGKGYYLADTETTLKYAAMRRKRALAEFKAANLMMLRCTEREGIKVPVRAHFRTIGRKQEVNRNQISIDEREERI